MSEVKPSSDSDVRTIREILTGGLGVSIHHQRRLLARLGGVEAELKLRRLQLQEVSDQRDRLQAVVDNMRDAMEECVANYDAYISEQDGPLGILADDPPHIARARAALAAKRSVIFAAECEKTKALQAVVDKLLEWNADNFEDFNPGPYSDSHSTRWICPVCQTSDEHEDGCPVDAALKLTTVTATEDEPQGARDEA